MAIVTSQTLSSESGNNQRDASFSCYLRDDERILALNPSESNETIFPALCASHEQIYTHKKKNEDIEIGVFPAEKYFKEGMDDDGNTKLTVRGNHFKRYQHQKDVLVNIDPAKLPVATRSVRSASSSNSQTTLLPANRQHGKMKKASSRFFLTLGCICSCNDKNSFKVYENQNKAIIKKSEEDGVLFQTKKAPSETWADRKETHFSKFDEMGVGLSIQECFTFPILNEAKGSLAAELQLAEGEDNVTRKSAEVFGSPIVDRGRKYLSFERKTTMLKWNPSNPKKHEFGITANPQVLNNDSESDASSDLFEIESFSTKTNSFLGRQTSYGASSCISPTTCYSPSEASIEWSVVTASAAEFSIMSDSEELRTSANTRNQNRIIRKAKSAAAGRDQNKRRPNILLGCKSHKAVRVAGDAYKITDKVTPKPDACHRLDSCKPVARFQAETKLT